MDNLLRERNRKELEPLLTKPEYQQLLNQAKKQEPALKQFTDWAEVMTLTQSAQSSTESKTQTFSAVLQVFQKENDPRWTAVLLAAYRLTLVAIHMRKIR